MGAKNCVSGEKSGKKLDKSFGKYENIKSKYILLSKFSI